MQVDIMAIAAHPDDVELSCSGTLLRHIDQGRTVGLVDLTRGELGTRGTAEIRDQEAAEAARLMGAAFRENLRLPDGFFDHSEKTIRTIIQSLRAHRPEIVLINAPSDRHPDHGRAAHICRDACFFSGLLKIKTWDANGKEQEKWRPKAVYHFIQDHNLAPDFVVDITDYIDRKMELVRAFRSQFFVEGDPQYAQEQATPISGQDFYEFLRAKARTYGRPAGFEYGEGFICTRTPGVEDLFHLR
jgi:bacillithiol biosynthesis deacetylase BshB1